MLKTIDPYIAAQVETGSSHQPTTSPYLQSTIRNDALVAMGLRKQYGKKVAVNNISITVQRGEAVGLFGPNGAGKTSTFYMLAGLLIPDSGTITIDGISITHAPTYQRAQHGLAYLPQEMSIFREMTVAENILAVLEVFENNPLAQQSRLEELLSLFRLDHVQNSPAISLSGGERRKLEIARLMTGNPKYILMDEPLAGIDPLAINEIRKRIESLCEQGIGICITDHNVRDMLKIVHRAYIVHDGQILREGTPETIATDEDVRRVYLGENFSL